MNKPLERNLQATAIRKFKALRARDKTFAFRKRHGTAMGVAGDPDFYGSWDGVHWELELKAPGERPTKLQDARRQEWQAAGAYYGVVDSALGVDGFIQSIAEHLPPSPEMLTQIWRRKKAIS